MIGVGQLLCAVVFAGAIPSDAVRDVEHEVTRGARSFATLENGAGVRSKDGRFEMSLGLLGQMRASADFSDRTRLGWSLPLARPDLRAKLWGGLVRARVFTEFAGGDPHLLDAVALVTPHEAFAVQVGQFRPWLSRGYRTGLNLQALGERGPIVDTFRIDRDVGATVRGRPFDGRFEYYIGVLNAEGKNTTEVDDDVLLTARMVVAPLGRVAYDQVPYLEGEDAVRAAVGASGYTRRVDLPADRSGAEPEMVEHREVGASADAIVTGWRVMAWAEGFWRTRLRAGGRRRDDCSAYGQLSALLVRDRLDVAARAGVLHEATATRVPVESGFNVYLYGNSAKLQARYRCIAAANATCAEQGVMLQAQLWI